MYSQEMKITCRIGFDAALRGSRTSPVQTGCDQIYVPRPDRTVTQASYCIWHSPKQASGKPGAVQGVIGDSVAYGLIGLILGPMLMGIFYELVSTWMRADTLETDPRGEVADSRAE
jgi:hypothetical protein